MSDIYAVIMAGGRGERFWPLSTETIPKPFIPLLGRTTLLQQTVERLSSLLPSERMLISIGEAHREIAGRQLPQIPPVNFIVEPAGRDTALCLGYCALHIEQRNPDSIMIAVPADHYVEDAEAYRTTLKKGLAALPHATAVVFGVRPSRPETGYGYIQIGNSGEGAPSLPVLRFVEKPDPVRAGEYLASGHYFWNSGMFLWRNRTLLELLRRHMPELYRGLEALRPYTGRGDTSADSRRIFEALPRISIDYGVMEKTSGLVLVPAEFTWDDIGNWGALERVLSHDVKGNVALGPSVVVDAAGCVSYSDSGTVAIFGVSNLIVVQAHGKVLVCPKDRAAELKRLIAALDTQARTAQP